MDTDSPFIRALGEMTLEVRAQALREYNAAERLWQENGCKGRPPMALSRTGQRRLAQRHMAEALKVALGTITIDINMLQARMRRGTCADPVGDASRAYLRAKHELERAALRIRVLASLPPLP